MHCQQLTLERDVKILTGGGARGHWRITLQKFSPEPWVYIKISITFQFHCGHAFLTARLCPRYTVAAI